MALRRYVPPILDRTPIASEKLRIITAEWLKWLTDLVQIVDSSPHFVMGTEEPLIDQDAAIPATPLNAVPLDEGVYRVTWYLRVTRPATTNSSVAVTIAWTDNGVVQSHAGVAIVSNLTTGVQSGSILVAADADTDISFETVYASTGATDMLYKLEIAVEAMG